MLEVKEDGYGYNPKQYEGLDYSKDIDFKGYFQSEKYWDDETLKEIRFKESYIEGIKEKYKAYLSKPTIAIGIRRGDYITGPQVYHILPITYYISALIEHFPDWRECNLIFISDDLPYCKMHFQSLPNAYFPEVTDDMEHMALMSLCDSIIMGNSTFYFWAAKLGNVPKVICPTKLFAGKLLSQYGDVNFYSDSFIKHETKKIDLRDVTFTIPVFYDHPNREQNLSLIVCILQMYFDTNIIIGEQGTDRFEKVNCKYIKFPYEKFHRTKMLNEMAKTSDTNIIANWDADVMVTPMQLLETVHKIRQGADMVYPYGWNFIRTNRKLMAEMFPHYDLGVYAKYNFPSNDAPGKPSVGGAVLWKKSSFMEIGMENEYLISFGPEDVERHERAKMLGLKVERVNGDLYHFNHWCGPDSSTSNPLFKENRALLEKQRLMNKEQLLGYINSWPWHSPYSAPYYETITEEAIRSRDEIFRIIGYGIINVIKTKSGPVVNRYYPTVYDFGAGVGQWGVGLKNYTGIDFRVPQEKLLIDPENYRDFDLRTSLNGLLKKADIVLCLEVGEHIEENYADILVENLVNSCGEGGKILFSAAIPFQGGNNHLNEQWQTYWAEKFAKHGYGPDENQYRKEIRSNPDISLWYKQNLVIYKKGGAGEVEDFVLPEYYYQIVKGLKQKT